MSAKKKKKNIPLEDKKLHYINENVCTLFMNSYYTPVPVKHYSSSCLFCQEFITLTLLVIAYKDCGKNRVYSSRRFTF